MCTRYFATVLSFGVGVLTFLCSGWFGMLCQNKAICTSDGIFLNILWACSLDSASCVNRKEVGSCPDDIAATAKCVCGFEWANSCHASQQLTSCSGPRCIAFGPSLLSHSLEILAQPAAGQWESTALALSRNDFPCIETRAPSLA